MRRYNVTIQGDRFPIREKVEAETFEEVFKEIPEIIRDTVKITRLTNRISIIIEREQPK